MAINSILEPRIENLIANQGKSWSSLVGPCSQQKNQVPLNGIKFTGIYPEWDEFYLLVCDICGQVLRPQALDNHIETRHKKKKAHTEVAKNRITQVIQSDQSIQQDSDQPSSCSTQLPSQTHMTAVPQNINTINSLSYNYTTSQAQLAGSQIDNNVPNQTNLPHFSTLLTGAYKTPSPSSTLTVSNQVDTHQVTINSVPDSPNCYFGTVLNSQTCHQQADGKFNSQHLVFDRSSPTTSIKSFKQNDPISFHSSLASTNLSNTTHQSYNTDLSTSQPIYIGTTMKATMCGSMNNYNEWNSNHLTPTNHVEQNSIPLLSQLPSFSTQMPCHAPQNVNMMSSVSYNYSNLQAQLVGSQIDNNMSNNQKPNGCVRQNSIPLLSQLTNGTFQPSFLPRQEIVQPKQELKSSRSNSVEWGGKSYLDFHPRPAVICPFNQSMLRRRRFSYQNLTNLQSTDHQNPQTVIQSGPVTNSTTYFGEDGLRSDNNFSSLGYPVCDTNSSTSCETLFRPDLPIRSVSRRWQSTLSVLQNTFLNSNEFQEWPL